MERPIEMGAQWIHGINGSGLYDFCASQGLLDGAQIDESVDVVSSTDMHLFCAQRAWDEAMNEAQNGELQGQGSDSLGRAVIHRAQQIMGGPIDEYTLGYLLRLQCDIEGADSLDDVSLNSFDAYQEPSGGNVRVPGGYSRVVDALAGLAGENNIRLHSKVSHIHWGFDGNCRVDYVSDLGPRSIGCSAVIFTASLGVLKREARHLFFPPLPPSKLAAIDSTGFGSVNKVWTHIKQEACEEGTPAHDFVVCRPFCEEVEKWSDGVSGGTWDGPNVVCSWLSGHSAREMEFLSEVKIAEEHLAVLNDFHVADMGVPSWSAASPCSIRSQWHTNELFRGSYSYLRPGSSVDNLRELSRPLGCLHFAGEATHSTHFSTVLGAFESGQDAAYAVVADL